MAFIRYKAGTRRLIPEKLGLSVWLVLHGYQEPADEKQSDFVAAVEEVVLNWHSAPDEYIKHNFADVAEKMIGEWRVDLFGRPSRPDYGPDLRLAEKWGLWARGKPTALAAEIISRMKAPRTRKPVQKVLL